MEECQDDSLSWLEHNEAIHRCGAERFEASHDDNDKENTTACDKLNKSL